MKPTKNKILKVFTCALMVFAVSCQSAQTKQALESLKKKQSIAAENSALSAKASALRQQMSNAQYEGDYLSAAEIRKELREISEKMEPNRSAQSRTMDSNGTEASYFTGGYRLNYQSNGSPSYVSSGQDTTSSRMLRTAK